VKAHGIGVLLLLGISPELEADLALAVADGPFRHLGNIGHRKPGPLEQSGVRGDAAHQPGGQPRLHLLPDSAVREYPHWNRICHGILLIHREI
jgi:hypothetical protein